MENFSKMVFVKVFVKKGGIALYNYMFDIFINLII